MTVTPHAKLNTSPQRLRGLFEPQSIALIGASDKSTWSANLHRMLTESRYAGRLYYINQRSATVHGQPAVARIADVTEPVDLAFVMVPITAVPAILQEMVDVGV